MPLTIFYRSFPTWELLTHKSESRDALKISLALNLAIPAALSPASNACTLASP